MLPVIDSLASSGSAPALALLADGASLAVEDRVLALVWGACLLGLGLALVVMLARLLRETRGHSARLDRLAHLESLVTRLTEREGGLDLRRLEHVLLDMRDGQKRLETQLLAVLESRSTGPESAGDEVVVPAGVAERVVNRLLALGYERVAILTPLEDFPRAPQEDGELSVEARRDGALHKGRVMLRAGRIADVKLRSAYEAFP